MNTTLVQCVSPILLLAAIANAQLPPGWFLSASNAPSPRRYHTLVYDSGRQLCVLFGGSDAIPDHENGETWEWNGTTWIQRTTTGSIPARWGHAMAYDSVRDVTVLFGGFLPGDDGETWEYDGNTGAWTQRATTGPRPRRVHAMAYDSLRGVTVLFGGLSFDGPTNQDIYLADTWTWNGTSWTQITTAFSPTARALHSMAFDANRGVVVLFGGVTPSAVGDTWEWNGLAWTQRGVSGPFAGGANGLAYDSLRQLTVLFQGHETWALDGSQWTHAAVQGPSDRSSEAMAFDAARGAIVLHGGADPLLFGDTWTLRLSPSAVTTYGAGCGVPPPTLAAQPGSRPIIGQAQISNITNALLGFAAVVWGVTPQSLPLDFLGINNCSLLNGAEGEIGSFCASTSFNTAQHTFAIPHAVTLIGVHVYLQAWTLAPGYNPFGIAMSNGLDLVIGDV